MMESCLENLHFAHFICLSFVSMHRVPFPKLSIAPTSYANIPPETHITKEQQKRVPHQISCFCREGLENRQTISIEISDIIIITQALKINDSKGDTFLGLQQRMLKAKLFMHCIQPLGLDRCTHILFAIGQKACNQRTV